MHQLNIKNLYIMNNYILTVVLSKVIIVPQLQELP
jgi:hypothetical protein